MGFKIKTLLSDSRVYLGLLVVVVGVASFGLGRLSMVTEVPAQRPEAPARDQSASVSQPLPVPPPPAAPLRTQEPVGEGVVASKSGERYHYPWCPGAKQIKEANRITFASAALAEAAGYTRAANCPEVE